MKSWRKEWSFVFLLIILFSPVFFPVFIILKDSSLVAQERQRTLFHARRWLTIRSSFSSSRSKPLNLFPTEPRDGWNGFTVGPSWNRKYITKTYRTLTSDIINVGTSPKNSAFSCLSVSSKTGYGRSYLLYNWVLYCLLIISSFILL